MEGNGAGEAWGVCCRQNLLTLRVCQELEFLRTVGICPANSMSGKERPQVLAGRAGGAAFPGASAEGKTPGSVPLWQGALRGLQACYLLSNDKVLRDMPNPVG